MSLVSIIIPCYNHAHFLPQALESALAQTHSPCEIRVIDDGSSDNTAAVAARYPNIGYHYQTNQGLSAARNTGIRLSQGPTCNFWMPMTCCCPPS
ncbi:MAG: glycosyltransferase family 2 protein [Anaerolineae bacterium]|nr:glycosyltransferase family 2 protein [Anaerolineae bacterium]